MYRVLIRTFGLMIVLSFCFLCTSVNSSESEFVDQGVTVLLSCQARAAMVAFCLGTICRILFVLDLAIKGGCTDGTTSIRFVVVKFLKLVDRGKGIVTVNVEILFPYLLGEIFDILFPQGFSQLFSLLSLPFFKP